MSTSDKRNPDYLNPEALANLCCAKTGGKPRPNGKGGFHVRCPAHEDRDASLSVNRGDKGTVFKCFAGCTSVEVLASLGLKASQLFSARVGSNPNKQVSVLRIKKDSDYSDNTASTGYTANTVTSPLLKDMPRIAWPRRKDNKDSLYQALFSLIRWLALDRGLRHDPDVIPDEARKVIEAWRAEFAKTEDVMMFKEEVASRWHSAKVKIADGHIPAALRAAIEKPPASCPKPYNGSKYESLFGICFCLAENEHDGIFIAPVRDIEVALELKHPMVATRMLRVLMMDGVIFKRTEFREHGYKADRFQLNPAYSSDPERKNRITVASWHRYTVSQLINMQTSSVQLAQVKEIQARRGLDFDTEDFCRRGEAAHWRTDYGLDLTPKDIETAVRSFVETMPQKKAKKGEAA